MRSALPQASERKVTQQAFIVQSRTLNMQITRAGSQGHGHRCTKRGRVVPDEIGGGWAKPSDIRSSEGALGGNKTNTMVTSWGAPRKVEADGLARSGSEHLRYSTRRGRGRG